MEQNSILEWPQRLAADRNMCFESIELLHAASKPEVFGDHMAFAVACSRAPGQPSKCDGCVHKLEITTAPDFANSSMKITHEVLPGQGNCNQIITANSKLRVAGFDSGAIIGIKNFGPKKTFNCDVRGRLTNHSAPVNCLACNSGGTKLASGSTVGEIAFYDVDQEEIAFLSRSFVSKSIVTGMAFFNPSKGACYRPGDKDVLDGDNMLIYSTESGRLGFIDTRVAFGGEFQVCPFLADEPRYNISALCGMKSLSSNIVFLGTIGGQLLSVDLRNNKNLLHCQQLKGDGCIRRMKEILVQDNNFETKPFVAYTNESCDIKILDSKNLQPDSRWECDRKPEGNVRDFCQVDDRIVCCGEKTSIGCWNWNYARGGQNQ